MASLGQTFVTKSLPQDTGNFTPLPAGWYGVTVKTSELKPTKAGDGSYINLRLIVEGPTHQGRNLFCRFNITNKNVTAEEIGRAQLRTVLELAGIEELRDTDQLVGIAFDVKVVTEISSYSGEMENDIKGFREGSHKATAGFSQPAASQPSPFAAFTAAQAIASQQPAAPAAQAASPWAQAATGQSAMPPPWNR